MSEVEVEAKEMNSMDILAILEHLPHRYPFLLVDRVLDYEVGNYLNAIKNITINEPCFPGHFPNSPIFPGVLILESLAQATGLLAFKTLGTKPTQKSSYYFVGIDSARFKKPVVPGDQVLLKVKLLKRKRDIWKFEASAIVDDQVVCSAELMCAQREV